MDLTRRTFLCSGAAAATAAAGGCTTARAQPSAVIDTHVHFYDPARPGGVTWPPANDALLYRTTLPANYRALPSPRPADGVIAVEASFVAEDNQWLLDLAARDPLIVGVVGNLRPDDPAFDALLARFARDPRFLGVRTRELSLEQGLADPTVVRNLRSVARRGLSFDVHFPPAWAAHTARLAQTVPDLRLIVNHVAGAAVNGGAPDDAWLRLIDALAPHPQIYMKVSGLVEGTRRKAGDAPADPAYYRPVLDALWERLGPDRLIYASDWPVSAHYAPLATVEAIALDYFASKGPRALDKVFRANACAAYGCSLRRPAQP